MPLVSINAPADEETLSGSNILTEWFWNHTATDIAEGDWVARDVADLSAATATRPAFGFGTTIKIMPTTAAGACVVGVAMQAIAAGSCGRVMRRGVYNAQCPASTLVGSALVQGGTAGRCGLQTELTFLPVIGQGLEAGGAGLILVDVRCA